MTPITRESLFTAGFTEKNENLFVFLAYGTPFGNCVEAQWRGYWHIAFCTNVNTMDFYDVGTMEQLKSIYNCWLPKGFTNKPML